MPPSGSRWWRQARGHAVRSLIRRTEGLPGPGRRLLRDGFTALPEWTPGKDSMRRIAGQTRSRRRDGDESPPQKATPRRRPPGGYGGYLHWSDAGSTYSEREIATFLQLELAHLKQALYAEPLPPLEPTGYEEEDASNTEDRIAEYLDLVEDSSVAEGDVSHLVILNQYPKVGAEYGNGFVHRRVKYYIEAGVRVHVAVVNASEEPSSYVYDGVPVLVGRGAEARRLLETTAYTSVSTHFLQPYIWRQVREAMRGHRLFSFMHGFESRRWIRTIRNYRSPEPLVNGIKDSLTRQRFWREVLNDPAGPEKFVFVSRWWRRGAQDDLEMVFPEQRVAVVHNVIDTELFRFHEKDPAQRFRLLWVRSAANLNYASDLAVAALVRLRETEWWPQLDIRIIGDGKYFGAFEETFADDENVVVERRFASQAEIARLHREYGMFLVPTRWDSQGVSRDEAMSSGLVAVTNAACAVPEFVDSSCAVVARPEDVEGLVAGMIRVFESPELFLRLARAGAQRVAASTSPTHTVMREMALMGLLPESGGSEASS